MNYFALLSDDDEEMKQENVSDDGTVVASNCNDNDDTATALEYSDDESIKKGASQQLPKSHSPIFQI